jgi:hypothetical protein
MCWRSIGELAGTVVEAAMLKAMVGTAGQRNYPRPRPPAATTGEESALRMQWKEADAEAPTSYPDAAREVAGRGVQGSDCIIWPGTAGHSLNANASREKITVSCTAPSTEALASAVIFSLSV